MNIIVGSTNQAKVKAVKNVATKFDFIHNIQFEQTNSKVSAQPLNDLETREGAMNRARQIVNTRLNTTGIGLEGGVHLIEGTMYLCNWGAMILPDGTSYTAAGAQIPLPAEIAVQLERGAELGPVVDHYFQKKGIRQKEGAIGMFTAGYVTRIELFEHILHLLIGQYVYHRESEQKS